MNKIVYVPLIVHGRDKYKYSAISCGCFLTKESTVDKLIELLIKNDFIPFDTFIETLSDNDIEELEMEHNDIFDNLDEDITEEQFIHYIKQQVAGKVDMLDHICERFGDSYYKDGWKFQIDEHPLIT